MAYTYPYHHQPQHSGPWSGQPNVQHQTQPSAPHRPGLPSPDAFNTQHSTRALDTWSSQLMPAQPQQQPISSMANPRHGNWFNRCFSCGGQGHMARACRQPRLPFPARATPGRQQLQESGVGNEHNTGQAPTLTNQQFKYVRRPNQSYNFPPHALFRSSEAAPPQYVASQSSPHWPGHPSYGFPKTRSMDWSSPMEERHSDHQGLHPGWGHDSQEPCEWQDSDLQALDFPDRCVPPGVQHFPIRRVAEPLSASMNIFDESVILPAAHTLKPGVPVSMYFRDLNEYTYYQNVRHRAGYGGRDPAFAQIDDQSHANDFADLNAIYGFSGGNEKAGLLDFDDDDHYADLEKRDDRRLSEQQENRLAALGVSGPALNPPMSKNHPLGQTDLPPWRCNEDSKYSRYFPGPSGAGAESMPTSFKNDDDRKRSRASDYLEGEYEDGERINIKTLRRLDQSALPTAFWDKGR